MKKYFCPIAPNGRATASTLSGAAINTMPIPMLKTRSISPASTFPCSCSQWKIGSTGHEPSLIFASSVSGSTRGTLSVRPPPGMRERVQRALLDERQERLQIRDVRREQRLAELADAGDDLLQVADDPPRERVAVRVRAGARQADEDVALAHVPAGDHLRLVDDADDEAGHVVVVVAVEARHLRRLPADEGAAVLAAGAGGAAADVGHHRRPQFSGGEVVEKEQRPRALDEDVVDAVADEVVADGVVDLHRLRDAELRADAVGRGDEDRVFDAVELRAKEAAEGADVGEDVRREGAAGDAPDLAKGLVLRVDVHARVAITRLVGHGRRV